MITPPNHIERLKNQLRAPLSPLSLSLSLPTQQLHALIAALLPQMKTLHLALNCIISIILLLTFSILSFTVSPIEWPIPNPEIYKARPWIHPEQVPFNALLAWLVALPCAILGILAAAWGFFALPNRLAGRPRWRPLLEVTSCLLVAFAGTLALAETFKLTVGRPRPYYFWSENSEKFLQERAREGLKSFPSGHVSNGFCGSVAFFLLLASSLGCFRVGSSKENALSLKYKIPLILVLFIPIVVAGWVAVTRVQDNKHWPSDVVAGALIGTFCSFAAFWGHFSFTGGICQLQGLKENEQIPQQQQQPTTLF